MVVSPCVFHFNLLLSCYVPLQSELLFHHDDGAAAATSGAKSLN
jgi:hypothetical protein